MFNKQHLTATLKLVLTNLVLLKKLFVFTIFRIVHYFLTCLSRICPFHYICFLKLKVVKNAQTKERREFKTWIFKFSYKKKLFSNCLN